MSASRIEFWEPPKAEVEGLRIDELPWDAVRVPLELGERVLKLLGADSGALIVDEPGQQMYWLVIPGAADPWDWENLHRIGVRILGRSGAEVFVVAVPPVHWPQGPRLYWQRYEPVGLLTNPDLLLGAILESVQ